MLKNPNTKYRPTFAVDLPDRRWPNQKITHAPIWLSTDLRDGNQALFEPMNAQRKLAMFQALIQIGFKEIEVGFPSASQTDFDFVRKIIDENLIPEDVTIMALTQARPELITRTVESLRGARHAIVHVYNATAPVWREVVFNLSVPQMLEMISAQVALVKQLTDAAPETVWGLEYSPEAFSMTELPVSLAACHTAMAAWDIGPNRPVILNLPTTVENATPNIFADQVEWMHRHLNHREHVILSVHAHNDRGTGVAASELAQMAGADRVEGCLLGNGERSGNVDLVTLALNLYTQGIDPQLDFSDISAMARVVEECTQIPTHPRHPYVGDLVYTSFSGSHQDAIKKGFLAQQKEAFWRVPYLPIDPADLGRSYDSVIRINSQSGKGGVAFLLERVYGVVMPRRMQVEFSAVVQKHSDTLGTEMSADQIWDLFSQTYLNYAPKIEYRVHHLFEAQEGPAQGIRLTVRVKGVEYEVQGQGNGPIDALIHALQFLPSSVLSLRFRVDNYEEKSIGHGADARALAIVEMAAQTQDGSDARFTGARFGVGIHENILTASVHAILSAVNRLLMA